MKYFIKQPGKPEEEVDKATYCKTEQNCGFRSKFGPGEIATSSFTYGSGPSQTKGRVEYENKDLEKTSKPSKDGIQLR